MKKISGYIWAFIVLICVFFSVGVCTLGSVSTGGKSLLVASNKTVYFSLTDENGAANADTVDCVYVKVGTIYKNVDETATFTVGVSTTASAATTSGYWPSANKKSVSVKTVTDGAEYNWLKIYDDCNKVAKSVSFTATANVELLEIVCLNTDGEKIAIKGYLPSKYTEYDLGEVAYACDAQDSFTASENAYHNVTAEEGYYITSAKTLLSGREVLSDHTYVLEENFNYLNTVIVSGSVAIFGASAFAIRLPAFLATCVLVLCAFLLMKELFKSEKYSFYGALLLCLGGMATTLGRLGAPYAIVTSAIVASAYFMYRFFARGISSKNVTKDALNILWSGLFAAVAMSIDASAVIPAIAVLALFGFGLRRQKLAYKVALSKTEGKEEEKVLENGEKILVNKASAYEQAKYAEKTRVSYGFAVLSFAIATVLLSFVSAVVCYTAFIKASGNVDPGFAGLIWNGLRNSIVGGKVVPFAAENASNAFSWFLPWKTFTAYKVANSGEDLVWNILPNAVVCLFSLIALLFTTFKVAKDLVVKAQDKRALRIRRAYFLLLSGLAAAMIAAAFKTHVSVLNSYLFHTCYVAFLPLAAIAFAGESEKKTKIADFLIGFVTGIAAVELVICLPSMYGFAMPAAYEKVIGWISVVKKSLV